eukprot:GILJ01002108.1.p1 GENE.GILJ01002108.1~~GILJ01002108.1.p1  ORF type:complete len:147 (-),score=18.86 GILJ01002108.1:225-665(-)
MKTKQPLERKKRVLPVHKITQEDLGVADVLRRLKTNKDLWGSGSEASNSSNSSSPSRIPTITDFLNPALHDDEEEDFSPPATTSYINRNQFRARKDTTITVSREIGDELRRLKAEWRTPNMSETLQIILDVYEKQRATGVAIPSRR